MTRIHPIEINQQTFKRFVMGKQGLYPGRRWRGKEGALEAVRAGEAVQIDPLHITARSHDLTLFSRVIDYHPTHLDALAHQDRAVFDYGNLLFYYPITDLPYFRPVMRWWKEHSHWGMAFAREHAALLDHVRAELKARGPLSNRHFEGNHRVESYRARKDTGLALRYLWASGELITHSRNRFERNFYFSEALVPPELQWEASDEQALHHFTRKALRYAGIATKTLWSKGIYDMYERRHPHFEKAVKNLLEAGEVSLVQIEGRKEPRYIAAEDVTALDLISRGEVPLEWQPLDTNTGEEAIFLAPLEIVSARGRAKDVFNFEYIWEVYKPAHQRRWGYYCLPLLYGDHLVGRFDPKMDRKANRLLINAFYLEDDFEPDDRFAAALGRGMARFVHFNGASGVDLSAIQPDWLRERVAAYL